MPRKKIYFVDSHVFERVQGDGGKARAEMETQIDFILFVSGLKTRIARRIMIYLVKHKGAPIRKLAENFNITYYAAGKIKRFLRERYKKFFQIKK